VRGWGWNGGPEDWVVVGEEGEDDAQEEACCWWVLVVVSGLADARHWGGFNGERDSRHTMRKVANDPFRRAMAKECNRWRKERGRH
jgi:hypothetical protein